MEHIQQGYNLAKEIDKTVMMLYKYTKAISRSLDDDANFF